MVENMIPLPDGLGSKIPHALWYGRFTHDVCFGFLVLYRFSETMASARPFQSYQILHDNPVQVHTRSGTSFPPLEKQRPSGT